MHRPPTGRRAALTAVLTTTALATSALTASVATAGNTGPAPDATEFSTTALNWPTHCLDAVPSGPADYQEVFDHRSGGWAGGDGGWPISLPDGRVLWLFGDTFMGQIDANNALLPGWRMVRSAQVQDGACFTPVTRGTMSAPTSFLPDQDGVIFWAAGGYVDDSVSPAVIRITASGICEGTAWRLCTVKIFTLSASTLDVLSVDSVPYDPDAQDMPHFGSKIFHHGGYVYLYGKAGGFQAGGPSSGGPYAPGLYVARAPDDSLLTGATWQYWNGSTWVASVGQAQPLSVDFPADSNQVALAGVIPWGSGVLMTGKQGPLWVFGPQVYAWRAPSPAGPWTLVRDGAGQPVVVTAGTSWPQTRLNYGGQLVTNVPGTSPTDPMVVISTNGLGCDPDEGDPCTPDNDTAQNVMLYGPHARDPLGLPTP